MVILAVHTVLPEAIRAGFARLRRATWVQGQRHIAQGSVRVKAEIFAIGTELLMGELTDTNSAWIAARLPALGIQLQGISIIGDSLAMLTTAFAGALQRSEFVFTTGGLGPTQDDLTREAIAATLQETPTVQAKALKELERYFQQRGRSMPSPSRRM